MDNSDFCLLQMCPRNIPEAITSIRENVTIPRVFFRAFTEPEVCVAMNEFIARTNYKYYIINSDDVIVTKKAFDCVIRMAQKYDCATAYCNMHMELNGNMSELSNVCLKPISLKGESSVRSDFIWVNLREINKIEGDFINHVAGFALSSFKREILINNPLCTYPNTNSSDHHISYRLQQQGIPIYCNKDAFILHLRNGWQPLKREWLVGEMEPEIIEELNIRKIFIYKQGMSWFNEELQDE